MFLLREHFSYSFPLGFLRFSFFVGLEVGALGLVSRTPRLPAVLCRLCHSELRCCQCPLSILLVGLGLDGLRVLAVHLATARDPGTAQSVTLVTSLGLFVILKYFQIKI